MKKMTYGEFIEIGEEINNIDTSIKDKLTAAIDVFVKRAQRIVNKRLKDESTYSADIFPQYALTSTKAEDKGAILYDTFVHGDKIDKSPKVTPEKLREYNTAINDFKDKQKEEIIEILDPECYICRDNSWARIGDQYAFELLKGLIIPENYKEILASIEAVKSLDGSTKPPDPRPEEPKKG